MADAPGLMEQERLTSAGFSPTEVQDWRQQRTSELESAGFNTEEIDGYFGTKRLDPAKVSAKFNANLAAKRAANAKPVPSPVPTPVPEDPAKVEAEREIPAEGQAAQVTKPKPEVADSFLDALEAGWDLSVTGLVTEAPDMILPENAPMAMRIASALGTITGDVPAMVVGALGGSAAGASVGTMVLPGPGTIAGGIVGGGAGAFALPEAIRAGMMEAYAAGEVDTFEEYWSVFSAATIAGAKGAVIGGATAGVGGKVAQVVGKVAAPAAVKTTATLTAEVATMTTVGAGLEGRVPEPMDFVDGAILVGGLKGAVKGSGKIKAKLMKIYEKTGKTPAEVIEMADNNPKLRQELLSENVELPKGFETLDSKFGKPKAPEKFEVTEPPKAGVGGGGEPPNNVAEIMSKVGEKEGAPKGKLVDTNKLYTDFVDKLDPINRATKALSENPTDLLADQNPYMLSRVSVDHKAKTKHFLEKSPLDFKTLEARTDAPSLKAALEGAPDPRTLSAYLISKRAIEVERQGKKSGFNIEAAKEVVKENKAEYEARARKTVEFQNSVVDYATDAGLLTKESNKLIKQINSDYVPFKRIFNPDETISGQGKAGSRAGSLKAFRGSERSIQDPITSIMENTTELIRLSEANRPKLALIELAEKDPNQTLITKVKPPMRAVEVNAKEISKALDIPIEDAQPFAIFRTANKDLLPNQFAVMRKGKREVYQTTPELAEAINRLGGDSTSTGMAFKLMRGVTIAKKFGITFTPDFIARNLMRDFFTSSTFSKSSGMTPMDIFGSMGDIIKKNDTYYKWLKSGGANGAFLEMGDWYMKNDIMALQKETGFMNSARNVVRKPVEVMRVAAELSEQSLRLAEFKKVTKGKEGLASTIEGGFASREITVDFQRVGAKTAALNSITAFMNVSVQGLDRTARAVKADPKGVMVKSMAYITAPSVLLWWANKDDKRVQEIPRWERDLHWIIATDNWQEADGDEASGLPDHLVRQVGGKTQINKGVIYRIPKPHELGIVFGSMPERVLDKYFTENPAALKEFDKTMLGLVTPSVIPDALAPPIEQYFNKSFFTGRDIIPHHLQGAFPEYQFTEYSSETAKGLGKLIAGIDKQVKGAIGSKTKTPFASPVIIDHYIRSWSGALGQYALQIADASLKKSGIVEDNIDPTPTLADMPFIKAFVVRYPRAGSKSVQDFYDNVTVNKQFQNTLKLLKDTQNFDALSKELQDPMNRQNMIKLDGMQKAISTQAKLVKRIHRDPGLNRDEKRQLIDSLYLNMTEIAKAGNALMNETKKALEEDDGTRDNR